MYSFLLLSLFCHFLVNALCGFYVYLIGQPKRSRAKRRLPIEGELYVIDKLFKRYVLFLHTLLF